MTLGTWSFCYCSKIIMFSIVPFSIQDPIQIYFLCISILVHEYDFTCRCAGPFVQNCWAFFVDFPYVYRTLHYTYSDFLFISTKWVIQLKLLDSIFVERFNSTQLKIRGSNLNRFVPYAVWTPQTKRQCMICHWIMCFGDLGLGRAHFVLGFRAMAFCHWRFVLRSIYTGLMIAVWLINGKVLVMWPCDMTLSIDIFGSLEKKTG